MNTSQQRRKRLGRGTVTGAVLCACVLALTCGTAQAQVGAPQVVSGDLGFNVYCVQDAVNWSIDSGLALDGDFGSKTYDAVRNFQAIANLHVDGEVGPQTGTDIWAAIKDQMSVDGNFSTPYGIPIGNCYRVIPTSS